MIGERKIWGGNVARCVLAALVCTTVACGSSTGDESVNEEIEVKQIEQGLFPACDWLNAPTNATFALTPGAAFYQAIVQPPYGSSLCPNQANVAVTNTSQRSYEFEVTADGVLTEAQCAALRIDARLVVKPTFCLPGNRNCWHDYGTITGAGRWVTLPSHPEPISGCILPQPSSAGPIGQYRQARINGRAYNVSTNANMPNLTLRISLLTHH